MEAASSPAPLASAAAQAYEAFARAEVRAWQARMTRRPSLGGRLAQAIQTRINHWLPEKLHVAITAAVKHFTRAVVVGSAYTAVKVPLPETELAERETRVRTRLRLWRRVAVLEGAATGAAGFLVGLADFPLLLSLKMKFLLDAAALYGYDARRDYRERLFLLHIFQLTFSSQSARPAVYARLLDWDAYAATLPLTADAFDWRTFQQQYRDYIDLAKLAQLLPVIGAPVGALANHKLLNELADCTMNAYRLRRLR